MNHLVIFCIIGSAPKHAKEMKCCITIATQIVIIEWDAKIIWEVGRRYDLASKKTLGNKKKITIITMVITMVIPIIF